MRVMGLDFGAHTVGVAFSDETGMLATGQEIIRRKTESALRATLRRIEELILDKEVCLIVLGLPLHMDGRISERARQTLLFRDKLSARFPDIPIIMQDERLTSIEADELLRMRGISKERRRLEIDSMAAEIILQDYLNETWKK